METNTAGATGSMVGTPQSSAIGAQNTASQTPAEQSSSTGLEGLSPEMLAAYTQANSDGSAPTGAGHVEPSQSGSAQSAMAQTPAPSASPEFNLDALSLDDFKDPSKFQRAQEYAKGFAQRDQQQTQRIAAAEGTLNQFSQQIETPEGARELIDKLAAHHGLPIQWAQANGVQSQVATDPTTQQPEDPFQFDQLVAQQVEAKLKEALQPYQATLQQVQQKQLEEAVTRDVTAALPAINQAIKASYPQVTDFTTSEVMEAMRQFPMAIPPNATQEQALQGIRQAVMLAHSGRLLAPAPAVTPHLPNMLGHSPMPGVPESNTAMTREQYIASALDQAMRG